MGLIFILNLNSLTVCEATLGFMFLSYCFGFTYVAYKLQFPVVLGYLVILGIYNLWCHSFPWDSVFTGFLLLYIYNLAVMLFPALQLESILAEFSEGQKNITEHMLKEMEYFHVLEQLIFLYWGFRYAFPELFHSVFWEFNYLVTGFVYYGLLSCLVAKAVASCLFNPLTKKHVTMIGVFAKTFVFFKVICLYLINWH
jgi:hypothetical protein